MHCIDNFYYSTSYSLSGAFNQQSHQYWPTLLEFVVYVVHYLSNLVKNTCPGVFIIIICINTIFST